MRYFFLALSLLAASTKLMASETPFRVSALSCQTVSCIYGDSTFCNPTRSRTLSLKKLKSEAPLFNNQQGSLDLSSSDGRVRLDFSDGDQSEIFEFRTEDLAAFKKGSVLRGTFEDGYQWDDGYHVRAYFAIECKASR